MSAIACLRVANARSRCPAVHSWRPGLLSAHVSVKAAARTHTALPHTPQAPRSPSLPPACAAASAAAAVVAPGPAVRPIQQQPAQLTAEGLVPCTASLASVPSDLEPLLGAAVAAYRRLYGERLLGVYLRGSLVQPGCFVPGVSDADFLALHLEGGGDSSRDSAGSGAAGSVGMGGAEAGADARAALQLAARELRQRFPQCAKVELKSAALPAPSLLHALAMQQLQAQAAAGGQPQAPAAPASVPPSALQGAEALAFQLKTQAVCLTGWDLPRLLPEVAALPQLQLLPALMDDVTAALQAARQRLAEGAARDSSSGSSGGGGGSSDDAIAAVRWALKRCLRAAFELCLCCGDNNASLGGNAAGSNGTASARASSSSSSSSSSSGGGGGGGRVFTRDLFWCRHYAAQQHPELEPLLEEALQLYVALSNSSCSGSSGSSSGSETSSTTSSSGGSGTSTMRSRQEQVEAAMRLASQLAGAIDGVFLQRMLAEEPGWLTHHRASANRLGSSASSGSTGSSGRGRCWAQQLRIKLWAAAATAGGRPLEEGLAGAPPPPVTMPVEGSVLTLNWHKPVERQQAEAIITATAAADPAALLAAAAAHASSGGSGSGSSTGGGLEGGALPQAILLKGAAAGWPAVQRWNLGRLVSAGLEGRARLAPSLRFPFAEPRLAVILAEQRGPAALPSCVARMSAAEFAARSTCGNPCGLSPLVYGSSAGSGGNPDPSAAAISNAAEHLYFQAEVPLGLQPDIDLSPFAPWSQRSQAARVWVGPQGAVSPTHYDASHSFLAQVAGRKRMLFWPPDQLPNLYCYPDAHLLRRRSRLNVHEPLDQQLARFPLAARAVAAECLLQPGDVVFFPSRWAHYTESLDPTISVTWRFDASQ